MSRSPSKSTNFLPLYESRTFTSDSYESIFTNPTASQRYKELLPALITCQTNWTAKRFLYTKLEFNPENEVLRIRTLRARGFLNQEFHIRNIIPFTYKDMLFRSKMPDVLLPPFIDDQMVYFNRMLEQCLFCENNGIWNEETVNHPKLSLLERANEKDWMDRPTILD